METSFILKIRKDYEYGYMNMNIWIQVFFIAKMESEKWKILTIEVNGEIFHFSS